MQLMPDTAEWIAHKLKLDHYAFVQLYDPETNIRFGCWYLNYLSSLFHSDPFCVICAYHAGQGQVSSWLSNPVYSSDGVRLPQMQKALNILRSSDGRVRKVFVR